jgi:pimeloyl-ACP methyl ester carboxylesterase
MSAVFKTIKPNRKRFAASPRPSIEILALLSALLFLSCASAPNRYPGLDVLPAGSGSVYEFAKSGHEELLIFIDGSGYESVLGEKKNGTWISLRFGYYLAKYLGGDIDIAIPEKLRIGAGENHFKDAAFLRSYTVDGLAGAYAEEIDAYLKADARHSKVYLMAGSEGGLLLPKIYSELKERARIDKIVVWGAGGLSQYECFKILGRSSLDMPKGYKAECARVDEAGEAIRKDPGAIDKFYLGWPFARWASFFDYRPIDFYPDIEAPVLFVQGEKDWNSPVESVRYIESNLAKSNFEYMYLPNMGHVPDMDSDEAIRDFLRKIVDWLR